MRPASPAPAAGAGRLELPVAAAAGPVRHAQPAARRGTPSRSTRAMCMAPLPRAYQWADGSAYLNHVELVRKARNAEVPASFYTDPLMYQGGSDDFSAPATTWWCPARPSASTSRPSGRGHRRRAHGRHARAGAGRHPPADAGQRLEPAQPDPGRAGQGLRLLPEQAGHRLQPGGGDARRTGRRLGRPRAPDAAAPGTAARWACATPARR
jgi:hypothetical protein